MCCSLFTIHCSLLAVSAQTTDFSYQGILKSSGAPASGNFDFEFRLFDAASGGTQQGPTNSVDNVAVVNGVYAVTLNFGTAAFNGGDRYLDVSVRMAGGGTLTPLSPRQKFTSTPYALRSLNSALAGNALQLGGQPAGDYLTTTGNGSGLINLNASNISSGTLANARLGQIPTANIPDGAVTAVKIPAGQVVKSLNGLEDIVTLAAGPNITITPGGNTLTIASTGGGILNQTTLQTGANFSIDGTGTANIISATTQFNLGGSRILSTAGTNNLFAGVDAGGANTTGARNAFFGRNAGESNMIGNDNAFFGYTAGQENTTGLNNSFFGASAGRVNTTASNNSFFGYLAGGTNVAGAFNSFFGTFAGQNNTDGSNSTFFGYSAGRANTTGDSNAFFGNFAGNGNTTGLNNAFFGESAGSINTTGGGNVFVGRRAGNVNTTGSDNSAFGDNSNFGSNNLTFATAIGAEAIAETSNRVQLGRDGLDTVRIGTLGAATATNLCIRPENILASCSSSGRYKKNIEPLGGGLNLVRQLSPVTFDWKDRDERDLGLIAEEVAKIDPLLVTRDRNGQIQGVKYDQLSVVLINAVKEQQTQIEQQQSAISSQQSVIENQQLQIGALKKLVCLQNPTADVCKEER